MNIAIQLLYRGFPLFGSIFDLLDLSADAFGAIFGILMDQILFPSWGPGWLDLIKMESW